MVTRGRFFRWMVKGIAVALLSVPLACGGGSPTQVSPSVPPLQPDPRNYVADLKTSLATYRSDLVAEVATGDPNIYVDTAYYLHGMVSAAEASGDTALMDELLGYIDQMIALAQPLTRNGLVYQEWGPWDINGNPQQLNTFASTVVLARVAAIIAGQPAFKARYGAQFGRITAFVDQSIFKYWFDKNTGVYADPSGPWLMGKIPWVSTDLGGWGSYDYWPQQALHFGTIAAWMYQATHETRYLETATRLAKGFKARLVATKGHWMWDAGKYGFEFPDNQEGCPDTSHANRVPMMVLSMFENGIVFTDSDVQMLARTFLDVIWNNSDTNPMFSNYIDGSNLPYRSVTVSGGNGIIFHGWAMLGRYSPEVQRVVAISYQAIVKSTGQNQLLNASLVNNSNSFGRIELAGTLARNGSH